MKSIVLFLATTFLLFSANSVTLGYLEWQDTKESKKSKLTWYDAKFYCQELKLNDKEDWRLPTLRELQSLINIYAYKPAIKKAFKYTTTKRFYWSSTINASNNAKMWHVFYKYGESHFSDKTKKHSVRCVRNADF